jgi:hypothetical protein
MLLRSRVPFSFSFWGMSVIVPCHSTLEGRWIDGSVGWCIGWLDHWFHELDGVAMYRHREGSGNICLCFPGVFGTSTAVGPHGFCLYEEPSHPG